MKAFSQTFSLRFFNNSKKKRSLTKLLNFVKQQKKNEFQFGPRIKAGYRKPQQRQTTN